MTRFDKFGRRAFLSLTAGTMLGLTVPASAADDNPKPEAKAPEKKEAKAPQVEVVFCLDTTGSMGGLIEGAKQKIWAIANQIAGGKPAPQLKIGLVAYKDRGDEYVTKVFELTDDLDAIHGHLKTLSAAGGGDEPESVNQALHDAVHKIKWSDDTRALKIIFLVGDAPPHMDYKDDVKYPETCQVACKKGIIINTIQCGASPTCATAWKDICVKAEGSYVQIAQDGGVVAIATPFDKDLAKLNAEVSKTALVYGDREKQLRGAARKNEAEALTKAAPAAAADRAGFIAKGGDGKGEGRVAADDLIDSLRDGKVKLEEIKKDELPKELKDLSPEKRKEYVEKVQKQRTELNKQILELDKKRSEFIQKKLAADKKTNGFDSQVLEILRKQAKKHKIDY
jgi:Mg-chelatase subunit ChlD